MLKYRGCPLKIIYLRQSLTNFSGATITTSKPTALIFKNKSDAIKEGWIDSPGAWSLPFNHNPGEAQTEAMRISPAFPPLLLKLKEEMLFRGECDAVVHAMFNRGHSTGWLRNDVSSYPRAGRNMAFSHWCTNSVASSHTRRKHPGQMRLLRTHISCIVAWKIMLEVNLPSDSRALGLLTETPVFNPKDLSEFCEQTLKLSNP